MMKMNKNKKGQSGFVITAELLLIVTILVFGLVTGWSKVRDQSLAELGDTGDAIGAIDQSYQVFGTRWLNGIALAAHAGFAFLDDVDTAAPTDIGGDGQLQEYASTPTGAVTGTAGTFEATTF